MNRLALLLFLLSCVTDADQVQECEIKDFDYIDPSRTISIPQISGIMLGYYKYG